MDDSEDIPHDRSIRVLNFPHDEEWNLQLHLENVENGGGDVEKLIKITNAIDAVFVDQNVAEFFINQGSITIDDMKYKIVKIIGNSCGLCVLEVTWNSASVSERNLKLYLENKKRSGGGWIKRIVHNSDFCYALCEFCDSNVLDAILKINHKLSNTQLSVKKVDSEELDSLFKCCSVKVIVPRDNYMSFEEIQLFFENKTTGGGHIVDIFMDKAKRIAVITYNDHENVEKLMEYHRYDPLNFRGQNFCIEKMFPIYSPLKFENHEEFSKKMILLKELPNLFKNEELINFLNMAQSHYEITHLLFSSFRHGVALVFFQDEIDYRELQDLIYKRAFQDRMLSMKQVKRPTTLRIYNCEFYSEEELLLYFEQERFGNFEAVFARFGNDHAFVTFKDPEAVEKIMETENELTLIPIYDELGDLPKDVDNTTCLCWLPQQCLIQCNINILKFIMKVKEIQTRIENEYLNELWAEIDWGDNLDSEDGSNENILIKFIVFDDINHMNLETVRDWEKHCIEKFTKISHEFDSEEISFSNEIWLLVASLYCDQINVPKISPEDNDKSHLCDKSVLIEFLVKSLSIKISGLKKCVEEYHEKLKKLKREEEEKLDKLKQVTTLEYKNVKLHQTLYLQKINFSPTNLKCKENFSLEYQNNGSILLKGLPTDVNEAKIQILELVNQLVSQSFEAQLFLIKLLSNQDFVKYIEDILKNKNYYVIWTIENNYIVLHGMDKKILNSVQHLLHSEFAHHTINVDTPRRETMKLPEWNDIVSHIKSTPLVLMRINENKTTIELISTKNTLNQIIETVKNYFHEKTIYEKLYPLPDGYVCFIEKYLINDLKELEKNFQHSSAKIAMVHKNKDNTFSGCLISGTGTALELISQNIDGMKKKIIKDIIEIKGIGQITFFTNNSNKGKMLLENVQHSTGTYICEYSEDASASLYGDKFMEVIINDKICIQLILGNLIETNADVIVNAANSRLQHSGGVAAVISTAAGISVQDECNDYIKENKEVPTSELYISAPGRLNFQAIIHAVGPIYSGAQGNARNLLYKTIDNILQACEKRDWSNVAMPAISTGIYGFPLDKAANIIIESIEDFSKHSKNVKIVQIVDVNANVIKEFQKVLKPKNNVEIISSTNLNDKLQLHKVPLPATRTVKNLPIVDPDAFPTMKSVKKTSTTYKPKSDHIPLKFVKGTLVDQKVDVIVNSASSDINLNNGTIAKMILDRGGAQIQVECDNYIQTNGNLNYGDVAITVGHQLPCKYVFHGVCAKWDNLQGTCEMAIKLLVNNSLEAIDEIRLRSIAMPSFGTGQLGVPANYVAKWMYEATDDYFIKNPNSKLNDLRVVVYDQDFPTIRAFEEFLKGPQEQKSTSKKSDRKLKKSKENQKNYIGPDNKRNIEEGSSITLGKVTLEICQGDITDEVTDAIVNSTDKLFGQMGKVSQAIKSKGGEDLIDEYKKIDKVDRIVRTSAGKLPVRYIYHIDSTASSDWVTIEECLEKAEKDKLSSISFPLLGTGAIARNSAQMTDIFLNNIAKFSAKNPSHLNNIRIIIFEDNMVLEFKKVLNSKLNPGFLSKIKGYFTANEFSGIVMNDYLAPKTLPAIIKFNIYSLTKDKIDQAKKELHSSLDDFVTIKRLTDSWKDIILKLTDDDVKQLESFKMHSNVEITINKKIGLIELSGLIKDVDKVYDQIIEILNSKKSELEQSKEAEIITKQVKWMFLEDHEYVEYPQEIACVIEKAFNNKDKLIKWDENYGEFKIKFDEMKEYSADDSSTPVKRVPNDCYLPLTWDHMDENETIKKVELSPQSTEYKTVEKNIKATDRGCLHNLVKIERIQNASMFKQYAVGRDVMKKIYKPNPAITVERTLWHGTSVETIPAINAEGFNRSYSGKNATYYGEGSYFAKDFHYSAQSTYSRPDLKGQKYIYQCLVLTGEFTQGGRGMKVPPVKANGQKYDSTVDNINKPSIFVVYNDTYAYPEYIITFN